MKRKRKRNKCRRNERGGRGRGARALPSFEPLLQSWTSPALLSFTFRACPWLRGPVRPDSEPQQAEVPTP